MLLGVYMADVLKSMTTLDKTAEKETETTQGLLHGYTLHMGQPCNDGRMEFWGWDARSPPVCKQHIHRAAVKLLPELLSMARHQSRVPSCQHNCCPMPTRYANGSPNRFLCTLSMTRKD